MSEGVFSCLTYEFSGAALVAHPLERRVRPRPRRSAWNRYKTSLSANLLQLQRRCITEFKHFFDNYYILFNRLQYWRRPN